MSYEISRGSCVLAAGIVPGIPLIPQHPLNQGIRISISQKRTVSAERLNGLLKVTRSVSQ